MFSPFKFWQSSVTLRILCSITISIWSAQMIYLLYIMRFLYILLLFSTWSWVAAIAWNEMRRQWMGDHSRSSCQTTREATIRLGYVYFPLLVLVILRFTISSFVLLLISSAYKLFLKLALWGPFFIWIFKASLSKTVLSCKTVNRLLYIFSWIHLTRFRWPLSQCFLNKLICQFIAYVSM